MAQKVSKNPLQAKNALSELVVRVSKVEEIMVTSQGERFCDPRAWKPPVEAGRARCGRAYSADQEGRSFARRLHSEEAD
jgi:antitoxin (DNA-binding transcriptional repressor) of toxin-antitoxin stability system